MGKALNKTGRPMFYAISNWGHENTTNWAPQISNSWRTWDDIRTDWGYVKDNFLENNKFAAAAGPGGWNDADMLEVGIVPRPGYSGLSIHEQQTHFALWCMMKSPLLIGADLRSIPPESLAILKNKELIAVNQDP